MSSSCHWNKCSSSGSSDCSCERPCHPHFMNTAYIIRAPAVWGQLCFTGEWSHKAGTTIIMSTVKTRDGHVSVFGKYRLFTSGPKKGFVFWVSLSSRIPCTNTTLFSNLWPTHVLMDLVIFRQLINGSGSGLLQNVSCQIYVSESILRFVQESKHAFFVFWS